MTHAELQAAIDSVDPELSRLKLKSASLQVEADAALKSKDKERASLVRSELDAIVPEMEAMSSTLDTLLEIAESMKKTQVINYTSAYAEAVESRREIDRIAWEPMLDSPNGAGASGSVNQPVPKDWKTEMAALIDAESFYWSSQTISIVQTSAAALPAATIVEPELFPVKAGWWWFGKDNGRIVVNEGKPRRVAAMAWLTYPEFNRVWVGAFSADWPELESANHTLQVVWHGTIETGRTINDISAEFPNAHKATQSVAEFLELFRFLVGGLLFIRQRVLISRPEIIARGARKRAAKWTTNDALHIVHLRRGETLRGHITERGETNFTCQWWVRGHWRQQPYKEGVRPKWIDPYIKGDADAPMKQPRETVFAVVR